MLALLILGVVFVVGVLLVAGAIFLARQVVLPRSPRTVRVYEVLHDSVVLERNRATAREGEFGLWLDRAGIHLRVGRVLSSPAADGGRIGRRILARTQVGATSTIGAVEHGRWTGHVFPTPEAVGIEFDEIDLSLPGGHGPAWLFRPQGAHDRVWAIHLHGIRTTRITALRTVPLAGRRGYVSLVPSFRGDGEGPHTLNEASMLGQTEWHDAEEALRYAVGQGATQIVVFGWSMGAQIALQLIERSTFKGKISALVLIAPAADWRSAIRQGAAKAKLPHNAGRLAEWALSSKTLSPFIGIEYPIDFESLDWTRAPRVTVPTLVVHSTGDADIPFSSSQRFRAANPDFVELIPFVATEHAWEYNSDAELFEGTILRWLIGIEDRVGLLEDRSETD